MARATGIYPYRVLPGVVCYYTFSPTQKDSVGYSGVYVHSVYIYDFEEFQAFKNFTGNPDFYFSWN